MRGKGTLVFSGVFLVTPVGEELVIVAHKYGLFSFERTLYFNSQLSLFCETIKKKKRKQESTRKDED